jgi:bifunctional ADP-heptose synthase (sugar kinase/adenylyltransferase)
MSFTQSSHNNTETHGKKSSSQHPQRLFDHVMCFGTFDIFHPGHKYYLSEAAKYATEMTVVIARDDRVEKLK